MSLKTSRWIPALWPHIHAPYGSSPFSFPHCFPPWQGRAHADAPQPPYPAAPPAPETASERHERAFGGSRNSARVYFLILPCCSQVYDQVRRQRLFPLTGWPCLCQETNEITHLSVICLLAKINVNSCCWGQPLFLVQISVSCLWDFRYKACNKYEGLS